MDFVEQLKNERIELQKRIDVIDLALSAYGVKIPKPKPEVSVATQVEKTDFPINGRTDNQILWFFKNNVFDHAVKLSDVQIAYNDYTGRTDISINNVARRLKRDEKLAIVKYNGQNKSSFWGLAEWIDGNDFSPKYRPSEDLLPPLIETTEVVIGNKEE